MSPSANGILVDTPPRLTLVGGPVFTRVIEHTFENRMILVMQEVLL